MKQFGIFTLGLIIGATALFLVSQNLESGPHGGKSTVESESTNSLSRTSIQQDAATPEKLPRRRIADMIVDRSEFDQTRALYNAAGTSSPAELELLIKEATTLEKLSDRDGALYILFMRMAEVDPQRALELAWSEELNLDRSFLHIMWRSWVLLDFKSALEAAANQPAHWQREYAANTFYDAVGPVSEPYADQIYATLKVKPAVWVLFNHAKNLSRESPQQAVDFVNSISSLETQRQVATKLGNLFGHLFGDSSSAYAELIRSNSVRKNYKNNVHAQAAMSYPEQFIEQALNAPASTVNWTNMSNAFELVSGRDFERAETLWQQIEGGQNKDKITRVLIKRLAGTDPENCMAWAMASENPGEYKLAVMAVEELWKLDPQATLAIIDSTHLGEHHDAIKTTAIGALTLIDPELGIARLQELPDSPQKASALKSFLTQLAPQDAETTIALLIENQSLLHDTNQWQIISGIKNLNPQVASKLLERLTDGANPILVSSLFGFASQGLDNDGVQTLLRTHRNSPLYQDLVLAGAPKLVETDLQRALGLANTLTDIKKRNNLLETIAMHTAYREPLDTLPILEQLEPGATKNRLSNIVADTWLDADPTAALQWVRSKPAGSERDHLLNVVVDSDTISIQQKISLSEEINDRFLRKRAVSAILTELWNEDKQAARQYLQGIDDLRDFGAAILESLEDCYASVGHQERRQCGYLF